MPSILRDVLQEINKAVFIHDLSCNLLGVNDEAVNRYGYPKEDFLGLTVQDLETNKETEKIEERIERIKKEGSLAYESRRLTKEGEETLVKVSSYLFTYEEKKAVGA